MLLAFLSVSLIPNHSLAQLGGPPPRTKIPDNVAVLRDLPYVKDGASSQKLDLYLNPGTKKRPLVILIHGGAFMFGDKSGEDAGLWLKEGYHVATLNYRLSREAKFPAAVQDCKSAVRWLRAHASEHGIDADRFGVFGASAGGNLAALIGTTGETDKFDDGDNLKVSSRVSVVGDWFGPTDFLKMDEQRYQGGDLHNSADSPESQYLGGEIQTLRAAAKSANPITYIGSKCPPFFIAHGDQDRQVPFGQSVILSEALEKAKIKVMFREVSGQGHMFRDKSVTSDMVSFFNAILKPSL
jgi:acetyl esterase/lipase